MKSIGIKALKNQLSRYLNLVRQGEVIMVTDRDDVIAEIRRPTQVFGVGQTRMQSFIADGVARGVIEDRVSDEALPIQRSDLPKLSKPGDSAALLESTRAERS